MTEPKRGGCRTRSRGRKRRRRLPNLMDAEPVRETRSSAQGTSNEATMVDALTSKREAWMGREPITPIV
jgi:hypothetical protein